MAVEVSLYYYPGGGGDDSSITSETRSEKEWWWCTTNSPTCHGHSASEQVVAGQKRKSNGDLLGMALLGTKGLGATVLSPWCIQFTVQHRPMLGLECYGVFAYMKQLSQNVLVTGTHDQSIYN